MKRFILGIILGAALASVAPSIAQQKTKAKVVAPTKKMKLGTPGASTSWNYVVGNVLNAADGSQTVNVTYVDSTDSHVIHAQAIMCAGDGSQCVDDRGNQIAAPVPAALATAGASYRTQVTTLVGNGITAGKLKP